MREKSVLIPISSRKNALLSALQRRKSLEGQISVIPLLARFVSRMSTVETAARAWQTAARELATWKPIWSSSAATTTLSRLTSWIWIWWKPRSSTSNSFFGYQIINEFEWEQSDQRSQRKWSSVSILQRSCQGLSLYHRRKPDPGNKEWRKNNDEA